MDFETLIQKELETERSFLKQYEAGLKDVKSYEPYRLSEKREKEYYAVHRNTKKEKYLLKNQLHIVNNLRKYKLCQTGITVLEKNLKALENLVDIYKPYDPVALQEMLSASYQPKQDELMKEVHRIDNTKRFTQSENPYHTEHLKHITSFGLIVRSRIEAAAAELAYNRGYYIMYEKKIILFDEEGIPHVVYPDFILLKDEYEPEVNWTYWEHLGMLDFEEYREQTMLKLKLYPQNGILPGRNLILTTDGVNQAIDMMAISNVLKSVDINMVCM